MKIFFKLLERLVISILFSVIMLIFGFSFLTGKFPPSKNDFQKVFKIAKEFIQINPQILTSSKRIEMQTKNGEAVDLEQMLEFQRLAIKRTELLIEFNKIVKIFNSQVEKHNQDQTQAQNLINQKTQDKTLTQDEFNKLSQQIETSQKNMTTVSEHLQNIQTGLSLAEAEIARVQKLLPQQ